MKKLKLSIYKNILKKGKMILLPITLATTILFGGCSLKLNINKARYSNTDNNSSNSYVDNSSNVTSIDQEVVEDKNIISDDCPMKGIKDGELTATNIKFNDTNYTEFNNYLSSLNTYYDYENLYNFDSSLNEYNKLQLSGSHMCSLNDLSVDSLVNQVKNNNLDYKKTNKTSIYKELESNELREICKIIIDTVNNYMKDNKDISIDRIKCVLSNLKIFNQGSSVNNAFVTDDNCLVVSPNMMQIAKIMNGNETDKDVIIHEINHLLQKGCNCDLNKNENLKRNFGFSYGFKNIKVNSLDFSWIYEASAEKNMTNLTGHKPLVYENMIGYLESLSLVNILNDNYKVNDTEKLSFKRTLDDLYNYFNVTSDLDKKEILNMMYSIQVIQQAPSDFYNAYEETTGKKKDSSVVDEVNYTVKSSACETLTKLFYRNLSKSLVNKNMTLEDTFYLISHFENDLNVHIGYNEMNLSKYNEKFMETYIQIQDNFFYQLSKCLNISQEEVEEMFNNYSSKIRLSDNIVVGNYSLSFLEKEKVKYLEERESAISNFSAPSIRKIHSISKNNNQKVYN